MTGQCVCIKISRFSSTVPDLSEWIYFKTSVGVLILGKRLVEFLFIFKESRAKEMDQTVPRFVRIGVPIAQGPMAGSEVKCSGIIHFTILEFLQVAVSPLLTPAQSDKIISQFFWTLIPMQFMYDRLPSTYLQVHHRCAALTRIGMAQWNDTRNTNLPLASASNRNG